MFALFFNNGFRGEQRIEGIHSFNTQSQHFDHVKKKDTRLRQILVNHHIATSPESSQT